MHTYTYYVKSFAMRKTHTSLGHKHEICIRAWGKSANICLFLCERRKSSMELPKWDAHERRVLQKNFIDEKFCPIPHGNRFSTRAVYLLLLLLQRQTFVHNNKATSTAELETCWPLYITSDREPSIQLYICTYIEPESKSSSVRFLFIPPQSGVVLAAFVRFFAY